MLSKKITDFRIGPRIRAVVICTPTTVIRRLSYNHGRAQTIIEEEDMARNVMYYDSGANGTLADLVNLPYTDVIVCFLRVDDNLNVYGDGDAFDPNTGNLLNPGDVQALQNAGKKVLVSFGGDPSTFPSSDWQRCAENVFTFDPDGQSVLTNNIISFVASNGFDGVDIDFEDTEALTGTGPYDGIDFLIALTSKISRFLPNYQNIITHAPQPPYWDPNYYLWPSGGTAPYTQIWRQVGELITWINCQFYDNQGYDDDAPTKVMWYNNIAAITGPEKLLVGALLPNGGSIGSKGIISLDDMVQNVIGPLENEYGDQFGGFMGWQFAFDQGGSWANGISQALAPMVGPGPVPPVPEMGNLYVFHQGSGENGQLWYSVFDGSNWAADTQISNVDISGSPSAAVFSSGTMSVFHQGYGDSGQLWYSYFDGTNWETDTQVPNLGMSESPSAVFYNGLLYVFHQGSGGNGQLWYSVFDGANWSDDTLVPNLGMSGSPSAVAWAGGITVFHQGSGDGQLWYTYSPDGTNWSEDTLVQNIGMSESPSAVVYNGLLYVFHQGSGDNGQLWYSVFDGSSWNEDTLVLNLGMSGSPSAVAWAGGITVFHQGSGDGQLWYTYSGDGTDWGGDTLVQNLGMSESPSAVVF
jgi:chitinase